MSYRISRFVIRGRDSSLRAFCDVAIGERLLVKGIRIVEGRHGLFVSMPRQRTTQGKWYDSIVPLTKQARDELHQVVLTAYHAHLEQQGQSSSTAVRTTTTDVGDKQ